MTVVSYSPYFKLRQVKEPVNREIEIYAKMHQERERHERDAQRAMEHQARVSELCEFGWNTDDENMRLHDRIAELEAALEPFAACHDCRAIPDGHPVRFMPDGRTIELNEGHIRRARAALRNR